MTVLSNLFYILIALVVLMFMITVHELGHYIAGRILGFKINEFSIGMGPKIFSKRLKNDQIFSLRWLPLGGYCAFEGEDEDNPSPQAFNNQKPWKRIIVLFSGAFMNFISALIIVIIAFSCFGDYLPTIVSKYDFDADSQGNAIVSPLEEGDVVLEIDGKAILLTVDLSNMIQSAREFSDVLVLRDGQKVLLEDVPKANYTVTDDDGKTTTYYGWGATIALGGGERVRFSFGESLQRSLPYCLRAGGYVLETLGGLITGLIGLDQIGGPITTIDITSQIARSGFANILMLITLISVNLAVFNLLPIPALDGSKIIFVIIEWIRGKPLNRQVEAYIHFAGLVLLFGFVILIDLMKILG